MNTKWKFSTVVKWFFNFTENRRNDLNVLIKCPIILTRPITDVGKYSITVSDLTSNAY